MSLLAHTVLPPRLVHAYRVLRNVRMDPFEAELALVPRWLSPAMVSIDVGANLGLYTHLFAEGSARVLAFEPHPACARYLRRLNLKSVEVIEAALSNRETLTYLRVPRGERGENHRLSTIATTNGLGASDLIFYPVETLRLDDRAEALLGPYERVSLIKIDVEGHEDEVLSGSLRLIARHRPVLIIEIEARHGADPECVFRRLAELDYGAYYTCEGSLHPLTAARLVALQAAGPGGEAPYVNNVVFLPRAGRLPV